MALEFVIDYPCSPKRLLAGDDPSLEGTRRLLGLWKLHGIAEAVRAEAAATGQDPNAVRIQLHVARAGETGEPSELKLDEIESQTETLRAFATDCAACPVSGGGRLAGCIRAQSYPIPAGAEDWLLNRVASPDSVGGYLLRNAIRDFTYDGLVTRELREKKLFEAAVGPERDYGDGTLSSDSLWHAILGVGPILSPWHAAMLLVWFDALGLDGALPVSLEGFDQLVNWPVPERPTRTGLALGAPGTDAGERAGQRLLAAFHSAWCHGVGLQLDG